LQRTFRHECRPTTDNLQAEWGKLSEAGELVRSVEAAKEKARFENRA